MDHAEIKKILIAKLKAVYHVFRKYYWAWKYRKAAVNRQKIDLRSKKKLIVVSHSAVRSGAPMLALHIVKELKQRGYQLFVVLMEPGEMTGDFFSEAVSDWGFGYFHRKQRFDTLKKQGFDWCLCNSAMSGDAAAAAANAGIRVVSLVHELPGVLVEMDGRKKAGRIYDHSDRIVFPSAFVKTRFLRFIKEKDKESIEIRPQGIYRSPVHAENAAALTKSEAKTIIAERFGLDPGKPVVLNAASVSERKGFDLFLRMTALQPAVQFVWLASEDNLFYRKCKKLYPTGDNYFEFGFIDDAELLYTFYRAADIVALTSREEPFASIVLEAFRTGTPVAAFDHCGGHTDLIKEQETGYLADAVDANALMMKIEAYLQLGDAEKSRMEQNCKTAAESMSFQKYVDYLENLMTGV